LDELEGFNIMTKENLINFPPKGEPKIKGILKSPGKISIRYSPYRMKQVFLSKWGPTRDGMIYMYIAFNGSDNATEIKMLKQKRHKEHGPPGPVIDLSPKIYNGNIPSDVQEIQIWCKGLTRSSIKWDSKDGNNYRFAITK